MIYTKSIEVDIAHQYLNDVIRLHEGDAAGAQLQITLFDNGEAFDVAAFTVKYDAVIAGYLAENGASATVSGNVITVPITANMCAKSGTLEIDVKIIEGSGSSAKTFFLQKFEAQVQRRVVNEDVIIDVSGTTIGEHIAALEAKFPVATANIADNAVTSDKLAANAVITSKIASGAVTVGKIDTGAVNSGKLATAAVITEKINDGAVTTAKIADGAVQSDKLANLSVTSYKIGVGAVITDRIADSAVTSDKIANLSVTTAKIATAAVTATKIEGGAIGTVKIANSAITTAKLADAAVTFAKLDADIKEHLMLLAPTVSNDNTSSLQIGQLFQSDNNVYVKTSAASQVGAQTRLALYSELNNLANIVGNTNDLLEAALNYQS